MSNYDNAIFFRAVTQPGNPWLKRPTWFDALRWAVLVTQTRPTLATMDTRLLADIGVSQGAALREASRKPWDLAPAVDRDRCGSGMALPAAASPGAVG